VFPELDISELLNYPDLYDEKQLKTLRNESQSAKHFKVVPALGIGLIKKPVGSRSVLNELEQMAEDNNFSTPIKEIFFDKKQSRRSKKQSELLIPATLSKSQQRILNSAYNNYLTLVIGPPGTGKSFTIAALAIEFLNKGQSVLIASKNDQAVNVVADKIENDFGLKGMVVKAGKKDYKKVLQKRVSNWLNGIGVEETGSYEVKDARKETMKVLKRVKKLEREARIREVQELKRGQYLSHHENTFFQNLRKTFLSRKLNKQLPLWDLMFNLENEILKFQEKTKNFIQLTFNYILYQTLKKYRSELQALLSALKAKTGNKKQSYFDTIHFDKILRALPVWVTNSGDINRVLPLQKELFDVVIIDEATQCDVASSLPILQRGKKAVIVGDPKQLRHLSFLSRDQQAMMVDQFELGQYDFGKLNYRDKSLLDLVSESIKSQVQVHFLDEHFRSMPDIIRFSNASFYNNSLRVMTASPSTSSQKSVFLKLIEGRRFKRGYNKIEAEAILAEIKKIIHEESALSANLCQSIGVLSPFREQIDYLKRIAEKELSAENFNRHKILIGTPFSFQGDERDAMFLSFVLDNESHPSAFLYLNREDVFNVSITRARSMQFIYYSFDLNRVNNDNLLVNYIQNIKDGKRLIQERKEQNTYDQFMNEVIGALKEFKLSKIFKVYSIAGIEIDIVTVDNGITHCIDLVGYPGSFEKTLPIERWKMLERIGIKTFALPFSLWDQKRETCIEALHDFFQIHPN